MSKKVDFKLNLQGLNELMKSPKMAAHLNTAAQAVAANAAGISGLPDGYEVEAAHPLSFAGIASVSTATRKARADCYENDTLVKAVGQAGLSMNKGR